MDLLKNTLRLWAMHREFRAMLAELDDYSDRELAGLGISRAAVARLARRKPGGAAVVRVLLSARRPTVRAEAIRQRREQPPSP